MKSLNKYIQEYKKQLEKGDIQVAYQGLMNYMSKLRLHFKKSYPYYSVAGHSYHGNMDLTFFSFSPPKLSNKKLKLVLVFVHQPMQFEIWLCGANKQIQAKYWKWFKEGEWNKYTIPATTKNVYSIMEFVMVKHPDFDHLNILTEQIEHEALNFIQDVENFLVELEEINEELL